MATEVEKIQRLLEEIGFRQITEADKDKEWYRAATSPVPCLEEEASHPVYSVEADYWQGKGKTSCRGS